MGVFICDLIGVDVGYEDVVGFEYFVGVGVGEYIDGGFGYVGVWVVGVFVVVVEDVFYCGDVYDVGVVGV